PGKLARHEWVSGWGTGRASPPFQGLPISFAFKRLPRPPAWRGRPQLLRRSAQTSPGAFAMVLPRAPEPHMNLMEKRAMFWNRTWGILGVLVLAQVGIVVCYYGTLSGNAAPPQRAATEAQATKSSRPAARDKKKTHDAKPVRPSAKP